MMVNLTHISDLDFFFLGVDYHWYRLDDDGKWSHKPGGTRVTQADNAGRYIKDPRKANSHPINYKFVCFMTTDKNDITIF